jgi:hypothetical protein
MKQGGRAPTKRDVEMARLRLRHRLGTTIAWVIGAVLALLAGAVPLLVVEQIIEHLAGETTTIKTDVLLAGSLVLNIPAALIAGSSCWKSRSQKKELVRLRARAELLEEQLKDCQGR